jgi:methylated-DNA-[protein]-cysteine S-methyltransferase
MPSTPTTETATPATTEPPATTELRVATMASPVGELRIVVSDRGVRAVLWETDVDRISSIDPEPIDADDDPVARRAVDQLTEYFAGERTAFDLPLDLVGTEFQVAAWQALGRIPFGTTRTYGEQAADIGRPSAVRAIGAANGKNPVSIVLPCHRVVGADGSLTGFAGGLDAKRFLLTHEQSVSGRDPETLFGLA